MLNPAISAAAQNQNALSLDDIQLFAKDDFFLEENSAQDHGEALLNHLPQNEDGLFPQSGPSTVIEYEDSEESGVSMAVVANDVPSSVEDGQEIINDLASGSSFNSSNRSQSYLNSFSGCDSASGSSFSFSNGSRSYLDSFSGYDLVGGSSFNSSNSSQSYVTFFSGCDSGSGLISNDDGQIEAKCGYSLIDVVSAAQNRDWDFVLAKLAANPLSSENSGYYEMVMLEAVLNANFELVRKLIEDGVSVQRVIEQRYNRLGEEDEGVHILFLLAGRGINMALLLLKQYPAGVNFVRKDKPYVPSLFASVVDLQDVCSDILRRLLEGNLPIDVNFTYKGTSVLKHAILTNQFDKATLLFEYGANLGTLDMEDMNHFLLYAMGEKKWLLADLIQKKISSIQPERADMLTEIVSKFRDHFDEKSQASEMQSDQFSSALLVLKQQIMGLLQPVVIINSSSNASVTDVIEQSMSFTVASVSESSLILSPTSSISFSSAHNSFFTAKREAQAVSGSQLSVDAGEAKRIWACK
ncbi:MAG: hypothetical protein A2X78_01140 [Gammaproteobacteria bacterium GWE2_37_16]|nr:MAG: hypothetical protein A2X78_01140 [Gammaproteobacteria bacterium GWE2_37_16]